MDAFGTVMTAFHAAHKVYELVKTIRDAPEEIQALQDQVQLMDIVLPKIKDVLQREGDSTSIALLVTKAEELTSTANPFLNKVKAIFQDKRKLKRLKWLFKAGEAKGLSEKLRAFHASLSVVCAAHSIEFPDHIRASLAELDQRLEESFASIHHRLRDVHAHLDFTLNATLVGVREVVQEELTMSLDVFMYTLVTTLKRELRTMANEQRRGESHNFDRYSVLYDTSDVAQATNLAIVHIDKARTYLRLNNVITAISYLLEVGVPQEWQEFDGRCVSLPIMFNLLRAHQNYCFRSVAELALYWIQVLYIGDRASQLQLLEQLQVRVIGPLLQDDFNGVATRFGMTELHQRLFLPGPQLTAEGLVDLVPLRNTPDGRGWTPLYYAIRWAPYAIEMLRNAGADLQLVKEPLHVAIVHSDSTIIGPLIHAGADVNERDDPGGCTPLIYLTKWTYLNKRYEKMNELMRHAGDKIDWDARDEDGKTALDYALEGRLPMKFVRLLKRYSSRDILEQGGGSAIQVGNWGWTYGDDGYANLYHAYCCWSGGECPLCVVERTQIREVTTEEEEEEEEEEASMPGGFKL
ncbi:hypothetical protein PHLCEN_2v9116 [Hermanssonia centrifuga]|uniref:protein S-acyltransferase n=1 Tax=Hermanssonia centrifuga TaxID=98765 RepID=A0A2R6NRV1_9APHY|nr:hypothetical protein PHLCEN_2v9116 [Hermanssonia centrifuga]